MFEPTVDVPPTGIMVSPVQHATLVVPLVFTEEPDPVTLAQILDAWRQIDIVSDQQSLFIFEP